jgi:hypothetical protein
MTDGDISEEQRLSLYVRTVLCGSECFPMSFLDSVAKRFKCGVSSSQETRMTTWVPKNTLAVMLLGTSTGENVVITCRTSAAYTLSPSFEIPPLPSGTVLMGNCTIDHDDTFRLLIYDGENLPAIASSTVTPTTHTSANSSERYDQLRDFFPRYFQGSDMARRTFVLQWVGFFSAASKFLAGDINVGHAIGGLISTTEDPMKPTRAVRITVPGLNIRTFRDNTIGR